MYRGNCNVDKVVIDTFCSYLMPLAVGGSTSRGNLAPVVNHIYVYIRLQQSLIRLAFTL